MIPRFHGAVFVGIALRFDGAIEGTRSQRPPLCCAIAVAAIIKRASTFVERQHPSAASRPSPGLRLLPVFYSIVARRLAAVEKAKLSAVRG
jgi:hypothetical protein